MRGRLQAIAMKLAVNIVLPISKPPVRSRVHRAPPTSSTAMADRMGTRFHSRKGGTGSTAMQEIRCRTPSTHLGPRCRPNCPQPAPGCRRACIQALMPSSRETTSALLKPDSPKVQAHKIWASNP